MKKFILGMLVLGIFATSSLLNAAEYALTINKNGANVKLDGSEGWRGYAYHVPDKLYSIGELNVSVETELQTDGSFAVKTVQFKEVDGENQVVYLTDQIDWEPDQTLPGNLQKIVFDSTMLYDFTSEGFGKSEDPAKLSIPGGGNISIMLYDAEGTEIQEMNYNPKISIYNESPNFMKFMDEVIINDDGEVIYMSLDIPFEFMDYASVVLSGSLRGVFGAIPEGGEVPEPSTIVMLLTGLFGMGFWGYRRRNRKVAEN